MSVAADLAPEVVIPAQARGRDTRPPSARLSVVAPPVAPRSRVSGAPSAGRRIAGRNAAGGAARRFTRAPAEVPTGVRLDGAGLDGAGPNGVRRIEGAPSTKSLRVSNVVAPSPAALSPAELVGAPVPNRISQGWRPAASASSCAGMLERPAVGEASSSGCRVTGSALSLGTAAPLTVAHRGIRPGAARSDLCPVPAALTRRGRLVLLIVAALLALMVIAASWLTQRSTSSPATTPARSSVVVESGDTLWTIAHQVAPSRDPRAEISDLLRLNGLITPDLVPGQIIRIR